MAHTRRDVTALTPGADSSSELSTNGKPPLIEFDTSTFTAAEVTCQELNQRAVLLPLFLLITIHQTINLALALHAMTGGATVSLFEGNLVGQACYAVSIYPERSLELPRQPSHAQLFSFIVLNLAVLILPGRAIGIWIDRTRDVHVLDVVVCPRDRNSAIELGARSKQRAIFDLAAEREIVISESRWLTESSEKSTSHV